MDFILDAHIPPSLCKMILERGHSAIHTKNLPDGNDTTDTEIRKIADKENKIVITKDTDFYHSHLILASPQKLLLVKTGNLRMEEFIKLFDKYLDVIVKTFETNNLIELHKDSLIY